MTNLIISLCNTFGCAQRRSLWRVEQRNATVFGTMARNQAMGGVVAVYNNLRCPYALRRCRNGGQGCQGWPRHY